MRRNKEVRGAAAIRDEVTRLLEHGGDCIKLVSTAGETIDEGTECGELQFTFEEIRAAAETAHEAGKSICTHTGTSDGVRQASIASSTATCWISKRSICSSSTMCS